LPQDKQINQAATSRNEDKITAAMLVLRDTSNRGGFLEEKDVSLARVL